MGQPVIQTGFTAGEIAPAVFGKVDIDAYHVGATTMRNFFVDYRSGASTRAGTLFVGPGGGDYPAPPRLIPFRFSTTDAFILLMSQENIRFIQNGGLVLEAAKDVSAVSLASPCIVTAPSHGFSNADMVFAANGSGLNWPSGNNAFDGRFFIIRVIDDNNFVLVDWITGNGIDSTTWSAYGSDATVSRVYTIGTPYQLADLRLIKYAQSGDVITFTHPSYPPADLVRSTDTDWTYTPITFGSSLSPPSGLAIEGQGGDGGAQIYSINYAVTAYNDATQEESVACAEIQVGNEALGTINGSGRAPTNYLTWDAVTGATRYNVYAENAKAYQPPSTACTVPTGVLGYIGQSQITSFTDTNIEPDFSQSPPIHFNPFSGTGANSLTITSPTLTNPPSYLGLLSPIVAFSGGGTVEPTASVRLSTDGWGNILGGGASIQITSPGDGLPADGGNFTVQDAQPGPGSGLVCDFELNFDTDALTSRWRISNACLASAFSGGSGYHPLLNSQLAGGVSANALNGVPAVPASAYNSGTRLGTGYLQGGAVTVRFAYSGSTAADCYVQGSIQLISGQASGMCDTLDSDQSGTAPTTYTWSIMYDDMVANIVTITGSVTGGVQGARTTTQVAYASYTPPEDGYGPTPYVVGGTTHAFAASNFTNSVEVQGTYTVTSSDNYPGVVCYFQGRKVFAASLQDPQTVWMSKPNLFQNMDYSVPAEDDDAIDITINAQDLSTIAHATPMSAGLVLLTADGAWQVTGGGLYEPVTPASVNAQPQAFSGASDLQPLRIGYELFYVQARGYAVRKLSYNFYINTYTGTDVSVLSAHLFDGRQIVEWAWAEQPFYNIWSIRDDGVALSMCYLAEQQIQGWARHDTQGYWRSVASIPQQRATVV